MTANTDANVRYPKQIRMTTVRSRVDPFEPTPRILTGVHIE